MLVGSCLRQRTFTFSTLRPLAAISPGYQRSAFHYTLAMSQYNLRQRPSAADLKKEDRVGTTTAVGQAGRDRLHSSHTGGSHSHNHAHGTDETAALLSAMKGGTDPGSRITLIGLGANVGLTGVKGVAGWVLGSAALLADAAHSGSDLLADVVTLTTYRMSRKPISKSHPYGYGKYESLGSLVVSFLLIGTALGIGLHSYHLLLVILSSVPGFKAEILASLDAFPHGHDHGGNSGSDHVDARAMWFAAGSIGVKEWLYRATLKVAKIEHSNVLLANAFHHRSDAFGSLVALGAIGGAWLGYPVLDPLGGLLVSGMILKQGASIGITSLKELMDQVTDPSLPPRVHDVIVSIRDPSLPPLPPFQQDSSTSGRSTSSHSHGGHSHSHSHTLTSSPPSSPELAAFEDLKLPILSIPSIRVFSSGPSILLDIQLVLPSTLSLGEANRVEDAIIKKCIAKLGGPGRVKEVNIRMRGNDSEGSFELNGSDDQSKKHL